MKKAKKHVKKHSKKGFSLIELLIVVAIILIIAAIAIPNLLRSRIAANEASAVGSVRTITTAEITYSTSYPAEGFGTLAQLGGTPTQCAATPSQTNACLIDNTLAQGVKSGYNFAVVPTANGGTPPPTNTGFAVDADAISQGTTGVRSFCNSTDGVIKYGADNNAITQTTTEAQCQAVTTVL
jgi:type IV pilus assembly protein PilA